MSPVLLEMLQESRSELVVLDSNLLLLWITVKHNPELMRSFKRVQMFSFEDAALLAWLIDQFAGVVTTPHILTEVSNLANGLTSWAKTEWFQTLADFVHRTPEFFVASDMLSQKPEFSRFGMTDAALSNLDKNHRVLTMDGRLCSYLNSIGTPCLDFTRLRRLVG